MANKVIAVSRKLSSKLCLLAPQEIQLLLLLHIDQDLSLDQTKLAFALTEVPVSEVRRKCPDIMHMTFTLDNREELIVVHMPRLSFEGLQQDVYLPCKLLCELMRDSYETWSEVCQESIDELCAATPVTETSLTTKTQVAPDEYVLVSKHPTAEVTLRVGNQLIQKAFPPQKHFQQLVDALKGPEQAVAWLAKTCQVSYYEPLSSFALVLADPPAKESGPVFVDEWKVKAYATNFMMTGPNGVEIGVATLEYVPPHEKTVRQTEDGEECSKQILF